MAAVNQTNAAGRGAVVTAIQQGLPMETMTGAYQFGAFGDPLQPQLYYYTVKDGKINYLKAAHPTTFMLK